jgi:hypothetical protein
VCLAVDDTPFTIEKEYGDGIIIGASSTKHMEENMKLLDNPNPDQMTLCCAGYWLGEGQGNKWKILALNRTRTASELGSDKAVLAES